MKPRLLLKGLVLIASFAAVGYAVTESGLGAMLDKAWIDNEVRGKGLTGEVLFMAIATLAAAIGVPRQMVSFLAGYAFGLWLGTGLALLASTLGCVVAFGYARLLGRGLVEARFASRIRRIDGFLAGNPFTMTLLIRFLPIGSNVVTNLVAGVTSVRPLPFFAGSAAGYVPQTLIFALLGAGIELNPQAATAVSAALFVVSALLGVHLFRRFRNGRALDPDIEAALDDETAAR
ncbi:MAG: VTT domain-containing protein [Alphaproteobacteria bacterium]|nr:VTT domain-containing protein [Alphaproteobacteria bacterium]